MMDMRPEDFPKDEQDLEAIGSGLDNLNYDQLCKLESWIQDLRERKKAEHRRAEIIAEMNDLFAELVEMDCVLYYKNGKRYELEIDGEVTEEEPGKIVIA